ncbi:amino acid ABC transporter substrate-binding protein [Massilia sp. Root418]|jgi:polar amino acid transport system substrate-binding protein|uniref:substrate-binding periplasmic protein n=1 Tax=Massilia sp. Root418 TaxID=1736532 RepID=UPI0006F232A2|nr:transporter substrate-binding domain-containing protein [Massilia sp. Root418]KQW87203.1 amino acid ABC transporter substrate-binding protein [Massilia sp. Root418]
MARSCLAWLSLAALGCALQVPAAAAPVETVTLCFERANVQPWRTEQQGGLNFALLRMVEQRLNIRFDFHSMPWKRCLAQLQANAYDGAFAVSYMPERRALGVFPGDPNAGADNTKRMHVDRYMLLRRKGSAVEWDGKALRKLDGPVGFQLGYSVGAMLRGLGVEVDEGSQRADELARKLAAGRVGAAAMGGSDAAAVMRSPVAAQLEVMPLPLIEKPYFLVLSHGMAHRRPELAQRIWNAMAQERASPAYKKLERAALEGEGG